MTISVNELINEVGMTSTITLIICTVIIAILLIGIYFRRRAKKRGRPAGPLETASQHILTKTKEEKKMARVRKRKVHWDASNGLGVVGYKLYWAVGKGVNYDSDFADLGNVTEVILPDDVPSFPIDAGDIELAVVAVDHIGNESDMTKLYAPFGFTAPDAPTGLAVETL
ncbi:MAG: hypothetical protein IMF11_16935 [Proteobacteria bacterium]|nr:hypothetical protein [Pseudomonadota bacterium]TET74843.1 MAG: hypothetical protein E3J56_01705 [Candidatus Aminicenantes bacterium]